MRTTKKTRSRFSHLIIALAALIAFPTVVALADDVSNNLDASVDAAAEVMPLTVGGANGTTQLFVTPRNGDGKNGCNLTSSTTLGVSVASSNPAAATVSPSSATFTSCSDTKTLTVTPVAQGSTTISVSQTSNNTGATFNLAPATFTVNVSPPPNTAPTVSVAGVTGGATYNKGSVPTATCQVTDAEDGNSSFTATLSEITGPYASDGIGSQTASCSYTDEGPGEGLTASGSETYSIVDPSAPSISYTLVPTSADGSNGWYKSDVSLTWDVTEDESPSSLQKTGCEDQNITSDQAATTYSCSATSAGGSATPKSVSIKRDGTAPTSVTGTPESSPNANGWYNSPVKVDFSGSDATSGIASCDQDALYSGPDSATASVNGTCTDNAGNSTQGSFNLKYDATKPTNVAFVGGPTSGGSYDFGTVPAAPTCTATDATSGLDESCVVSGYSNAVGNHTLTATATDKAGNVATDTRTYTVKPYTLKGFYQPIDMNDTVNTVKNGSTVPVKFELFRGTTELQSTSDVTSIAAKQVNCAAFNGDPIDAIETVATGGTILRYDATAGQFIYNWQTPKKPNTCYSLTMTAADGSSLTAYFKLR